MPTTKSVLSFSGASFGTPLSGKTTAPWQLNGTKGKKSSGSSYAAAATSEGNLIDGIVLASDRNAISSAFLKDRVNVLDSWTVEFTYTESFFGTSTCLPSCVQNDKDNDRGYWTEHCGSIWWGECTPEKAGVGLAFVVQGVSETVSGTSRESSDFGTYSSGYSGIRQSVGVVLDFKDASEVVIAQNGYLDKHCYLPYTNTPASPACTDGIHDLQDLGQGSQKKYFTGDLRGTERVQIIHAAARKFLYVRIWESSSNSWKEVVNSYVDISKSIPGGMGFIGFTADTSTDEVSSIKVTSFSFGKIMTDLTKSIILQNGFVVTSANKEGTFTVSAKDSCSYDKPTGGDIWTLRLEYYCPPCPVGVVGCSLCDSTVTKVINLPSPLDQKNGVYIFTVPVTNLAGSYYVKGKVNNEGTDATMGTIKIRPSDV